MEKISKMANVPIEIVAEILGKAPQYVRIGLQRQQLPIGSAVQVKTQWTYHVSPKLLREYIGDERIKEYEKNMA